MQNTKHKIQNTKYKYTNTKYTCGGVMLRSMNIPRTICNNTPPSESTPQVIISKWIMFSTLEWLLCAIHVNNYRNHEKNMSWHRNIMSRTAYQTHPYWQITGNTSGLWPLCFLWSFLKRFLLWFTICLPTGAAYGGKSHKRSSVHRRRITIMCLLQTSSQFHMTMWIM